MLARLGNVVYWLGCILAAATVAFWVVLVHTTNDGRDAFGVALFAIVAVGFWLIGRAFRYVLSGN